MAYATVAELKEYLSQVTAADVQLQKVLDRATAIISTDLGYSFGTATVGTATVYGDGTDYLLPPVFVTGSVTSVTAPAGYSVPTYVEQDGALVVTRSGRIGRRADYPLTLPSYDPYGDLWPYGVGWAMGLPYVVSATYGYATVPEDIKECCLELAVRIWRARDAGFSDVVGVEGSGDAVYSGAYPALVKKVLDTYKARSQRGIGVW